MEKYEVSIIVPLYNREKLIIPCIKSINSQTYNKSKWEVIFIDDASTDNSIRTIESLIDKSINYKIIKRSIGSGGASSPRNEGIKACFSKYVLFCDSDDYFDSQLLENSIVMAYKNDSDIVYVKMIGEGRETSARPFNNSFVDSADVLTNHLVRSLNPIKLIKLDLLRKNHILFIPSIYASEDQVFMMHVLTKAKKISILADKDYYTAVSHEGEHLSRKERNVESFYQTIYIPLSYIYIMKDSEDYDYKKKLYNAWLVRSAERIRDGVGIGRNDSEEFESMFLLASNYFNVGKAMFDLSQIYDNEKQVVINLLIGNFQEFRKLAIQQNLCISVKNYLVRNLKNEEGYTKPWFYKNKAVVLDFVFKDIKISYDLEVDENRGIKVWLFSRNKPKLIDSLKDNAVSINDNKILIFEGTLDTQKEVVKKIKYFLDVLRGNNLSL